MKFAYGILLFAFILLTSLNTSLAQNSINTRIFIDSSGDVTFTGTATKDPEIKGIIFSDGYIYGSTSNLTSKQEDLWTFSLFSGNFEDMTLEILLPDNSHINLNSVKTVQSASLSEEKGSIILILKGSGKIGISFNYFLDRKNSSNARYFLLIIPLIAIATVFYLLASKQKKKGIEKKKKPKKQDKLKILSRALNERENLIVKTLIKEGKKSTQGALQKLTGIPKAAFSRHLASLEKKGIIKKQGIGRLNKVLLIK